MAGFSRCGGVNPCRPAAALAGPLVCSFVGHYAALLERASSERLLINIALEGFWQE